MENKIELEWRMYGLVPYNISEIQKGIQYGHAVVEYGQGIKEIERKYKDGESKFYDQTMKFVDDYNNWADNWKTFMIMNGGTSNHTQNSYQVGEFSGTMEGHLKELNDNGIHFATFYEPDLNDMLSAIVFLVDERVFKLKPYFEGDTTYPDFEDWLLIKHPEAFSNPNLEVSKFGTTSQIAKNIKTSTSPSDMELYKEWVNFIGGDKNVFLRNFIRKFRLA